MNKTTSILTGAVALSALLYLGWPTSPAPGTDTYLEFVGVEEVDGGTARYIGAARMVGPAPDGGVTLDPELHVARTIPPSQPFQQVPSIGLDGGVYVYRWPENAQGWACAVREPTQDGCESLHYAPGSEPTWGPAPVCSTLAPGQWRGACTPKPCGDCAELPLGASMPNACKIWQQAQDDAARAAREATERAAMEARDGGL